MKSLFFALLLALTSLLQSYEFVRDLAQVPILTPSLLSRKTAKLRLDNGLEVYLISDPLCSQSAAALGVGVGSWNDPKEYPGMAHFLEHMLFMGTKTFPIESEYSAFIRDHGGEENAFTASDRTLYVFSSNHEAFSEALERFSHFFIDPLFLESCVERELHAVDEEYALCIQEESWRKWMILKETGNPTHPNRAFCIGNLETLQGIPRSALEAWHQKNYRPQQMRLVIVSALELDVLISLTDAYFSPLNANPPQHTHSFSAPLLQKAQKGKLLYIDPVNNSSQLDLTWEVPLKFARDQTTKAVELTASALSQASENSLYQLLKRERLAKSVQVSLDQISHDHLFFTLEIGLTEQGLEEIETVIEDCFRALATLKEKGIAPRLYNEFEILSRAHYQYQSREDSFETVLAHADNLIDETLETHPERAALPTVYDPEFISEFIQSLSPQECLFILTTDLDDVGLKTQSVEQWTGAKYSLLPLPQEQLSTWATLPPHPLIDLPPPNPYLPSPSLKEHKEAVSTPVLIEECPGSKIYCIEDTHYLVPQTVALFHFHSPLLDTSAKTEILLHLFFKTFFDTLEIPLYFAHEAGMTYNFSHVQDKICLEVEGFSDQVPLLLKEIFSTLPTVVLTEETFEEDKEILAMYYFNTLPPMDRARELLGSLLFTETATSEEKLEALEELSLDEYRAFVQALFRQVSIEGLLCGNISCDEATSLWEELKTLLPTTELYFQVKKSLSLPAENRRTLHEEYYAEGGNAALLALHQGSFSYEKRAVQTILSKALEEAFFDSLRTKQQTGYLVSSWHEVFEQELFQLFSAHSSHYEPLELLRRFDLFIEDFLLRLKEKISETRFSLLRGQSILVLSTPPDNLVAYARAFFAQTFTNKEGWRGYEQYMDCLRNLSYERFLELAKEILSFDQASIAILISERRTDE